MVFSVFLVVEVLKCLVFIIGSKSKGQGRRESIAASSTELAKRPKQKAPLGIGGSS